MRPVVAPGRASRAAIWMIPGVAILLALALPLEAAARGTPDGFADLAERASPAVVNISTTQVVRREESTGPERPQFPPGSPFEEFFREFFDRQGRSNNNAPRRIQSLGSGFVVDPAGYIVTNNHVIKDADEIVVRFADETQLDAKIVGRDEKTDLAVLKVEPKKPLISLRFGDSDATRVGDWVIAIGNPFGLGGTVTAGIISARGRDINAGPYDDFLQTDASINRGNSGGPMLNLNGDVIGINTAIFSPSGGSVGIGFAVPAALAKSVVEQLKTSGKVRRGWLGVRIQSVNDEIAESLGLKDGGRGALVASVTGGGPAEKAGIEAGDVVLSFDGKSIGKMQRLPRVVGDTAVGAKVPVEVWRKGQSKKITVTVGELPEDEKLAAAPARGGDRRDQGTSSEIADLGLSLANLSAELRTRFELAANAKGVVVTDVKAGGPAAEKGLRVGDLVVEVNQEEVKNAADVMARVKAARDGGRKTVLLLVDRKGDLSFLAVGILRG
ncbi:MAG: DegQ family serine endoprotease [Alphaproteobacteria bacterium]|nr:DegQ family serine endoprotease [Alphaproteobacteria bacterium]